MRDETPTYCVERRYGCGELKMRHGSLVRLGSVSKELNSRLSLRSAHWPHQAWDGRLVVNHCGRCARAERAAAGMRVRERAGEACCFAGPEAAGIRPVVYGCGPARTRNVARTRSGRQA